jgi:tetratricopeptide (TPR) repeat protein
MNLRDRFSALRKSNDSLFAQGQQLVLRGDYPNAESKFKAALDGWRAAAGPREEESKLVTALGKCLEAQRKYEDAYELYMQALNNLTGSAYDEVYTSFLYLNERMGTFSKKDPTG